MRHWRHLLPAVALAACTGGDSTPERPADLGGVDPAYHIDSTRYLLVGDDLTPATTTLHIAVTVPAGVERVTLWLDEQPAEALTKDAAGFSISKEVPDLAPGVHRILLQANDNTVSFAGYDLYKGHALYVVTSTDWDDADNPDESLMLQEQLHMNHPALLVTHLVGPYAFTDPAVSQTRRDTLAAWVKMMRDTYHDEIGTHIHPRCTFIDTTGVTCKSLPSTTMPGGDTSGYTVRLGAYSKEEWKTIFAKVDTMWAGLGFGKPTSFRAGGWTLEISTVQALHESGYLVDGSPNNWSRMEEWDNTGYDLYPWNKTQWSMITDTSQPYYPTDQNLQGETPGTPIGLLLLPDNGSLVDYVTGGEMTEIFHKNWDGGALMAPRQLSIGYHPPNFTPDLFNRIDEAMNNLDLFLAQDGAGPVVYARMSDMTKVFKQP